MSQYSLSVDSIGPAHGSAVNIRGAQIDLNSTKADYVFTGATASRTMGIYTTVIPPHVIAEFEGFTGATGNGAAIAATTLLPAAVRPATTTYIPMRRETQSTGGWATFKITTGGQMTMYESATEGTFVASSLDIGAFAGQWCTQAF